jgi:AmiR/NasT family two-component response regulator
MTLPKAARGSTTLPDVHRAEGVLAERLGLDLAAAAAAIRDEAAIRMITIAEVACEVLEGAWSPCEAVLDPWGSC